MGVWQDWRGRSQQLLIIKNILRWYLILYKGSKLFLKVIKSQNLDHDSILRGAVVRLGGLKILFKSRLSDDQELFSKYRSGDTF